MTRHGVLMEWVRNWNIRELLMHEIKYLDLFYVGQSWSYWLIHDIMEYTLLVTRDYFCLSDYIESHGYI